MIGLIDLLKSIFRKEEKMDIVALLNELIAKLQDAQAAIAVEKKASYDEGFAAGVASVPVVVVPGDVTPFGQADIDAAVSAALLATKAAIKAKLDEVEALVV
jgi:ribosomal protein L18E